MGTGRATPRQGGPDDWYKKGGRIDNRSHAEIQNRRPWAVFRGKRTQKKKRGKKRLAKVEKEMDNSSKTPHFPDAEEHKNERSSMRK